MPATIKTKNRARRSRASIERLYIAMRHLFIRGNYKPLGVSGEALIDALMILRPEIYGSLADSERVELNGLLYIFERLPKGIEECRFIKLISREGFENGHFNSIIAKNRRRNCYRIDKEEMFIEMTRGRSDIYDILTHLTFMFSEAEKIRRNSLDAKGNKRREWLLLEKVVRKSKRGEDFNLEVAQTYLSTILGRTYEETRAAYNRFAVSKTVNSLFHIIYWLGRLSMEEHELEQDREITFSSSLREKIGHHVYGERWANYIKQTVLDANLANRPIHIISANTHSVMNVLFAGTVLEEEFPNDDIITIAETLSRDKSAPLRKRVEQYAKQNGMIELEDTTGMNITVQLFDMEKIGISHLPFLLNKSPHSTSSSPAPVLLVMDYAFGEQAFEAMDELLKPYDLNMLLNVHSISIMGKAGTLKGKKGDIMIPNAHVFEGTADNYPFNNDLNLADFSDTGVNVYEGPMITVLGTSLQNRKILQFFHDSSWNVIGLEMEGAHYQKAIQAAAKIRKNIHPDVVVRYAYYASDNPLKSGQTLASGSLGLVGVKPTYIITLKILEKILSMS